MQQSIKSLWSIYLKLIGFVGTKVKQNWGFNYAFVIMHKTKSEKQEEVRARGSRGKDNDIQ